MTSVETVSIVIAAVSVVIGVINSIRSNRRADEQRQIELKTQKLALDAQQQALETRQAELFMQVYNRWNSRDFSKTYVDYRYHYDIKEHFFDTHGRLKHPSQYPIEIHTDWQILAAYFEGLGVLVEKGLIDVNLVEDLFAGRIIAIWEKIAPIIEQGRKNIKDPKMHDHFEHLYHEMKRREPQPTTVT